MRVNTFKQYPMTAEVWSVFSQDPDSGAVTYTYNRLVPCRFVTDGGRKTLLAETGLHEFDQIRNIRDPNQTEVAPDQIYVVKNLIPVVNVFGYAEEMSYSLSGA